MIKNFLLFQFALLTVHCSVLDQAQTKFSGKDNKAKSSDSGSKGSVAEPNAEKVIKKQDPSVQNQTDGDSQGIVRVVETTVALKSNIITGAAPLEVIFKGAKNVLAGSGKALELVKVIQFGDGEPEVSLNPGQEFQVTHTFAKKGVYKVVVKEGEWGGNKPAVLKDLGEITITVN